VSRPIKGEDAFVSGESSFLVGTWPQDALSIPLVEVLDILRRRVGSAVDLALSPEAVDLSLPLSDLPEPVRSPRSSEDDTSWMRTTNMIGINVRTVGDYAGVIKYALTLPRAIDSIHLLPIWEPGVVESLYGIASWNLNTEFFSDEWHQLLPQLDTVEKQLRAVSNLVHVMGKTIGMDVIPHTDRFSEAAVGTPNLFEWMRVVDDRIVDKSESLTEVVEDAVYEWLALKGSGSTDGPIPHDATALFALHEADRLEILFGPVAGLHGRIDRRIDLIMHLKPRAGPRHDGCALPGHRGRPRQCDARRPWDEVARLPHHRARVDVTSLLATGQVQALREGRRQRQLGDRLLQAP
jgi:hypothetical protein